MLIVSRILLIVYDLSQSSVLQWNVAMLLGWIAVALIRQHFERVDQTRPRFRRHDHVVYVATTGGHVGISEFLAVKRYQLGFLGYRIVGFGQFAAEDDVHCAIW